jgi:hypothetical protein
MKKIIDIDDFRKPRCPTFEYFEKIPEEMADNLVIMIVNAIKHNIRLALEKVYNEGEIPEGFPFYDDIQEIYSEFASGCYFCDDSIDPNEDQEIGVCMMCAHKLNKITGGKLKWQLKK